MSEILDDICRGAFDFFWRESHPDTGLTKDRATNVPGASDTHDIASIAATGYALAALPIGAKRGWVSRADAEARARKTLAFLARDLYHEHGFHYHFVDWKRGERVWLCELSSIDTALLVLGALTAGQYFGGACARDADALLARLDWPWMQNGPAAAAPTMGWKPESGFLDARWSGYTEALYLYVLGLGSPKALPRAAWDALTIPASTVEGFATFGGPSPLFWAQMTPAYLDLRKGTDGKKRRWWKNFENAHRADRAFCRRTPFKTFREGFWGITACDQPPPVGYGAHEPREGSSDGTVAPTAMAAGALFLPRDASESLLALKDRYGSRAWGKYGFCNAFNVDKDWFDTEVLGIDLGMALLCLENRRSGLIWKTLGSHPAIRRGVAAIRAE